MDTARSCLTQIVEKNKELDRLNADYSQFRKDVLEGTCTRPYSSQLKAVSGQLSTDEDLVIGLFCQMGPLKRP